MCSAIPCEAQGKYDQKEPSPESSSHHPSPSNKINVEDKKTNKGLRQRRGQNARGILCIIAFPVLKTTNDKINNWQHSQQVANILHKIAPNLTKPWLISYQLPI